MFLHTRHDKFDANFTIEFRRDAYFVYAERALLEEDFNELRRAATIKRREGGVAHLRREARYCG